MCNITGDIKRTGVKFIAKGVENKFVSWIRRAISNWSGQRIHLRKKV